MLRKFLALSAYAVAVINAAQGPGIAVSITQDGVSEAKNIITPYLFKFLQNVTVPEVDFDGGYLKNLIVKIPQPDLDNVNIKFDHTNNGADLNAVKVTATAEGDFHYKYLFFTVDGKIHVDIKDLGVDIDVNVATQAGTPSDELAPSVKCGNLAVNLNPDNVDITLSGSGLISKIANVLIPLLKSSVIPSVIQ